LAQVESDKRKSGIKVIGDVPWGTHFCQFYRTKEDLIDILVPYFKTGLENNEFCMWITSTPLEVKEAKAALGEVVKDLEERISKGQIEILDYSEWYIRSGEFHSDEVLKGWVEKERKAIQRGFDGLRLSGNTFWLERNGWTGFTEYEAEINSVIGQHKMIALCSYSLDKCNASEVLDVVDNHQFALARREGRWNILQSLERKKIGNMLERTEKTFSALYSSMTEGVAIHDIVYDDFGKAVDYIITDVNPSYEKITGLSRNKVLGRKASEVYSTRKPPYLDVYAQVASSGKPKLFETFFAPMNKHFRISVFSLSERVFATVFQDITEHKKADEMLHESERRLKETEKLAHLGSWELDLATNRLSWSDEVYRIFGIKPQEFDATYEAFLEAVHPEDRAAVDDTYSRSLREGRDSYEIEHRIVRKSGGETRIVHEKCEHIRDESGRIVRSVGMVEDVTERKRIEELRDQFVSAVTHELRTPLVSIKGYTDYLLSGKMGPLSPKVESSIGVVKQASDRLLDLTDQILDYRRLMMGKFELNKKLLDLKEIIGNCVAEIQFSCKRRSKL
jgi:PAS domain S-box-containing protein